MLAVVKGHEVALCVGIAGCTFAGPMPVSPDASPPDAMADAAPDVFESRRVRDGLIGFWTFDEMAGARSVADTSGTAIAVPLHVETSATIQQPEFANGHVRATMSSRIISSTDTHLAPDAKAANAATLEVWARPEALVQGSVAEPRFIAGLGANINARNIVLLHGGDRWVGMVRTGPPQDGGPRMLSTTAVEDRWTHLVLVADAQRRTLYVDGIAEVEDPPGSLDGWDDGYAMALFDEPQHARQWRGSLALVALYARALEPAEIVLHHGLGPDAP